MTRSSLCGSEDTTLGMRGERNGGLRLLERIIMTRRNYATVGLLACLTGCLGGVAGAVGWNAVRDIWNRPKIVRARVFQVVDPRGEILAELGTQPNTSSGDTIHNSALRNSKNRSFAALRMTRGGLSPYLAALTTPKE